MAVTTDYPFMSYAPWTPSQVSNLHRHQFGPFPKARLWGAKTPVRGHPFTCAKRDDGKHHDNGGDIGILIPTVSGWVCQYCDYKQNWAFHVMCEPGP